MAANHEAYLRHARGEVDHYEHAYRIRARDGQWRWYQERGRIVEWHDDGRPRRMVGTQTDITVQREREQLASQAAARLERIAQHVPGILYQFELDAQLVPRFPYLSERARALLGLDPQRAAVNAAELMDRIDPADREAVTASIIESAHRAVAVAVGVPRAGRAGQPALDARHLVADAPRRRRHRLARLHAGRDRAARAGACAPGQGRRRSRQPRQDRVPVAHEP